MSDPERRARVISVSNGHTKKAKVLSVGSEGKSAKIWTPQIGTPSPEDAREFVARYRTFAELDPTYGFKHTDLERMVMASHAAPFRYIFEERARTPSGDKIGHWMLYLRSISPGELRVYDPLVGVKTLNYNESLHSRRDIEFNKPGEAQRGPEVNTVLETASFGQTPSKAKVVKTAGVLLNAPPEEAYELPEGPLTNLGPIQKTAYDCGPLLVYAALAARKAA